VAQRHSGIEIGSRDGRNMAVASMKPASS